MAELDTVKALLGVTDTSKDVQISFAIDDAKEAIMNYCNIDDIPYGLQNTLIRMAVDLCRNESYGSESVSGRVNSLSEGDTSISYGSAYDETFTGSVLKDYVKTLNRYRRVVFK